MQPLAAPFDLPEWDLDAGNPPDAVTRSEPEATSSLALGAMSKLALFQRHAPAQKPRCLSYETGSTAASDS